MPSIWIKDFNGGLDTRRLPETTAGGVLMRARNGHISRGGEFEQRAAFVPEYELPAGTVGMFHDTAGIVVFGSGPILEVPEGVAYQRLRHPDGNTSVQKILSADLYRGKVYVSARFADGSIYHYYDGVRVTDWFDGRAQAEITVVSGATTPATNATALFAVTGGAADPANQITSVTVNGVAILPAPVPHSGSDEATAAAVASAINGTVTTPNYSASVSANNVTIRAATAGPGANGLSVVVNSVESGLPATRSTTMAGGAAAGAGVIQDVKVNGVSAIAAPVAWDVDAETTAAALATAVNAHVSTPDYTATTRGTTVTLRSADAGDAQNGLPVVVSVSGVVVTPLTTTMTGASSPARAPGTFTVTGGGSGAGSRATGVFRVARVTATNDTVRSVKLAGVELLPDELWFPASATAAVVAAGVANAIAAHAGVSGFTATSSGADVTVLSVAFTASHNGKTFAFSTSGPYLTISQVTAMTGGANPFSARFTDMKVNGVSIIGGPVAWAGSAAATASALTAAINAYTSVPDYVATVNAATVSLTAAVPSSVPDGAAVTFTMEDGMAVTPATFVLPNTPTVYQPGAFVKTIGTKMYATSGSVMHFSGIREPMKWTTDTVGAGFVDMSEETSGAEDLTALARYQNFVAVFAERTIQIWFTDPDPALNRQTQVLNNTGTVSPKSVTAFGDTDIFYLDESGLRSLRARDSSNAAATTDIGIPVDELVLAEMAGMSADDRQEIVGLIEPVNGRFWLVMGGKAFVFSYFPGSKISAWSEYSLEYTSESGAQITFRATEAMAFRRRVYLRAGDQIFVYSGLSGDVFDATPAEAWLPYLDANEPAKTKRFTGIDAAARGLWDVSLAMATYDQSAQDKIGILDRTTFDLEGKIPGGGKATHMSLRFKSTGEGPHKLASCVIHFDDGEKPR